MQFQTITNIFCHYHLLALSYTASSRHLEMIEHRQILRALGKRHDSRLVE